ncbi:Lipoprotein (plasmid) [Borrelia hermsii YBT]|uniref:Lipoprotein n=1 Tax=Borrelia hermsii YBT TaxID=1313295 RepID=W5T234_BORHE|nr:Lipoprotein [Borrelia hermsii YBT]
MQNAQAVMLMIKNTFKKVIKGSFKSNNNNLDQFKEQTTDTCGTAGS